MLKNSKTVALICGAASVVATMIIYLLTFHNIFTEPIKLVSMVFMILAECIGTVKAHDMKKSIFSVANIMSSVLYFGYALLLSILFVNFFPIYINVYIILNILGLFIMVIVDLVLAYFSRYINQK